MIKILGEWQECKYHLSYDRKKETDDSSKVLEEISKFLKTDISIKGTDLMRPTQSTIVFESTINSKIVLDSFTTKFKGKLYFVISRVAKVEGDDRIIIESNKELNEKYQENLKQWGLIKESK